MMITSRFVRRLGVAGGRGRMSLLLCGLVFALLALVVATSGCSAGVTEASATEAPVSASDAAAPDSVWPMVGIGQDPLFDLNVTEAGGFTSSERDYLRAERTAWNQICAEADRYASRTRAGDAEGAQAAIAKVVRHATIAGAAPSPSSRFAMLRYNVRLLMGRVLGIAVGLQEYDSAATDAEKTQAAEDVVRLSAPLAQKVLHVTDWGLATYYAYGGVEYPVYYATTPTAATTTTSAATTPTTTTTSGGGSSSGGGGDQPQPNPKPQPSLSSAERKQVAAIMDLDAWLMPVVNDSLAKVSAQAMPWTEGEVESFNLNMSYLYDQCSMWMEKAPAGSLVAAGLKEYQQGLSLVRSGALKMQSAAQYDDSAHQQALEKGADRMEDAIPYLNGGLAKLERWY
jgi:hypothetical protein